MTMVQPGGHGLTVQQDSSGGGIVDDDNLSGIGISVDKDVSETLQVVSQLLKGFCRHG